MARQRKAAQTDNLEDSLVREKTSPCKHFFSTGCTLLDLAISGKCPGGVGSGRVTQLIGDNSTCKSVIMQEILGSAQRQGGYSVEEEAEFTPSFDRAELFGLDVGAWKDDILETDVELKEAIKFTPNYAYRNPTSIEDVFDQEIGQLVNMSDGKYAVYKRKTDNKGKVTTKITYENADKIEGPICIGVDTFTALPSRAELDRNLNENSYNMERAKAMSAGFRKYIGPMGRKDITIIAVDHIRSNISTGFGKEWTVSGGKAMQQYASTRIFLKHVATIQNTHKVDIGIKVEYKIVKNKIAPPFRKGFFYLLFDYGIDDIRSNMEWLDMQDVDSCLVKKAKTWFWKDKKLGGSLEKAIRYIETNNLDEAIQQEVARVWNVVYAPTDRTRKHR